MTSTTLRPPLPYYGGKTTVAARIAELLPTHAHPMGKMFYSILAIFAAFEVDLLRARTKEGMAVARAKGKLRGRAPKLSAKQQRELVRMYGTGEYTIADLADVFTVSRATVYRTLQRDQTSAKAR